MNSLRDLLYSIKQSNICLERMRLLYFHIFQPADLLSNPRSFLWGLKYYSKLILSQGSSDLSSENLEFLYSLELPSLSTILTIVPAHRSFFKLFKTFPIITHKEKKTNKHVLSEPIRVCHNHSNRIPQIQKEVTRLTLPGPISINGLWQAWGKETHSMLKDGGAL